MKLEEIREIVAPNGGEVSIEFADGSEASMGLGEARFLAQLPGNPEDEIESKWVKYFSDLGLIKYDGKKYNKSQKAIDANYSFKSNGNNSEENETLGFPH